MDDTDTNPPMDDDTSSSGFGDAENPPMADDVGSNAPGTAAPGVALADVAVDAEGNPALMDAGDEPLSAADTEGNPPMVHPDPSDQGEV